MPKSIHPTRVAILQHLALDGTASPNDLWRRILTEPGHHHVTLGAVAYHCRALATDKIIVLDREERVRGAVEHFYRLNADGRGRRWRPELRQVMLEHFARQAADELERSRSARLATLGSQLRQALTEGR